MNPTHDQTAALELLVETAIHRVAAKMNIDVHPRIVDKEDARVRGWDISEARSLRIIPSDLEGQLEQFFADNLVTDVAFYTARRNTRTLNTHVINPDNFEAEEATYEELLETLQASLQILICMGYIKAPELA